MHMCTVLDTYQQTRRSVGCEAVNTEQDSGCSNRCWKSIRLNRLAIGYRIFKWKVHKLNLKIWIAVLYCLCSVITVHLFDGRTCIMHEVWMVHSWHITKQFVFGWGYRHLNELMSVLFLWDADLMYDPVLDDDVMSCLVQRVRTIF